MKKFLLYSVLLFLVGAPYVFSGPLGKYTPGAPPVPQQLPQVEQNEAKKAALLERELRIQQILDGMSDSERDRWLGIYRERMEKAIRNNNIEEARFYQRILDNARSTP